ncbi:16S rRNA (cytosine(1402)-N(4))-methyltransferase RsmH [Aestuariivirga litoralis]|uniref:16S rRNA (cytosine(1402)-N(4))-methyltransferase RsmH n=1 Tax=Aestuariivirga litoralis TaxID=2650924 RepID=UPI0018C728BF|nr:16S rRNA (cytosine(1402)-N(4))-methyltransferase RsmH [Aestuariivirga litoralis]MBG1231963.1 16S rRNA (cytosine(1402)-N(4))-methyltransferase RsmH [Aestuariivirga litoralis]
MPPKSANSPPIYDRHVPVMLPEVLSALAPQLGGIFIDGTFGAGGYTQAILESPQAQVIAIDRDPTAIAAGQVLVESSAGRLRLVQGTFSTLQDVARDLGLEKVRGVVLDIGVSSMQLDEADRGFSFQKDGPLDMRMSKDGPSAKDYVNALAAEDLANIIFVLGDEPRSRAIARAIVKARTEAPLLTTFDLVRAVERATGKQRATDRTHPATKTFQALRIHVNAELEELAEALGAAEEILEEGGRLVVVTFHSLEDRIVKRFFQLRSGKAPQASRHMPLLEAQNAPGFTQVERGAVAASEAEARTNPRARSAKLRFGIRTSAPPVKLDGAALGVARLGRH